MKVGCQQCGAAYSVADEKVAGRKLKLRCKKCGEPIQVDGSAMTQAPAQSRPPAAQPAARPPALRPAARVQSAAPSASQNEPTAEWHVAVAGTTQGPYTLDEIAEYYAEGNIVLDTLVYREGWPDWAQAGEVVELQEAASALQSRPTPPAMPVMPAVAQARGAATSRGLIERPVAMGNDPFGEPAAAVASPRVSAEEMFSLGVGHEGTVQFSIDQIRALSAVSAPSLLPAAPIRAGYASGEGSGLIDVASLAQAGAEPAFKSIVGAEVSPLDTMAPLSLPVAAARGGIDFRTKVFASLAALGLVLIGGVGVLAVTRLPPPAPAAAVQPVAATQPPPVATAPIAAAAPVAVAVKQPASEPTAAADSAEAVATKPAEASDSAPKRVAKQKVSADDGERTSKPQRRNGGKASGARDVERVAKAAPEKEKASAKASSSSADIDDLLLAKAPAKEKPSAPKKGGSASIDELLDDAVSAKKPAPKSESAEPKGDLPATPSRDDVTAAYAKAKAKVQSCKGSGVATAMISIKGSSGRASSVSVTGVDGAAKSCVETAVRSTPFPKFQKDKFEVKLPFKLAG